MSATVTLPLSEYESLKRKLDGQRLTIKELSKNEKTIYINRNFFHNDTVDILNPK